MEAWITPNGGLEKERERQPVALWKGLQTEKLPPLSLGSLKSRLWEVLNAGHHDVTLTDDEKLRIKTWIDLNCPLWPDYKNRLERPDQVALQTLP